MAMPKASVHEYGFAPRGEGQVWAARKIFSVEPVTVAKPMEKTPHRQLGLGVFRLYLSHYPASDLGCHSVDHDRS